MKRKTVMRLLCVSAASAMVLSGTAVAVAGEGTQTIIYQGQQMTATVNGQEVILPDGQVVSLEDCQILAGEAGTGTGAAESTAPAAPQNEEPEPAEPAPTTPESTEPENSGETGEGQEPENPGETGEGQEPENPGETGEGQEPENPGESEEGQEPENPGESEEGQEPENPGESGEGSEPETPGGETGDGEDAGDTGETGDAENGGNAGETGNGGQTESAGSQSRPGQETAGSSVLASQETPEKEEISFDTAVPSITAGLEFYTGELKDVYHLVFDEDFAELAKEIEEAYIQKLELGSREEEKEETEKTGVFHLNLDEALFIAWHQTGLAETETSNWQDVLAVYLLEQSRAGERNFTVDASDREELARIYEEMNPVQETEEGRVIQSLHIEDWMAKEENLTETETEFLETYTSPECSILCAAATGAEGIVRESMGEDVSPERAQVVAAAYSLVGKIPYFWGGKSVALGWDARWNTPEEVTAAGTSSTGTIQNYGLDCSGFVTWSFVNGYEDTGAVSLIGHGTATQWAMSEEITEEEALPGDLVFLQKPNAAGINHVGIVAGRNDDGSLVVVHCNAGDNGVTVESAWQAGFRYVRRPLAYEETEEK